MVAAAAYLLVMTAGFVGVLPVLVWLFGEVPDGTRFQNDYGKKEDHEMLMFSGLEAQSEINRLLDESYGVPGRTSLSETKRCSKAPETNRCPEGSRAASSPQSVEIVKQQSGDKVRPLRNEEKAETREEKT